jgi:Protein of unknown function (DUF3300)
VKHATVLIAAALLLAASPSIVVGQTAPPTATQWMQGQLDQLTEPIAVYPDPLLKSVLAAATYPPELVEAARWLEDPDHAALRGDDLGDPAASRRIALGH